MRTGSPGLDARRETRPAVAGQHDHGRAHVEAAEFLAARERAPDAWRSIARTLPPRTGGGLISPAYTVSMLPTKSAPTSTRHSGPSAVSKSQTTRSLRANRSGHRARRRGIDAEQLARHVARRAQHARRTACGCGDSCKARGRGRRSCRRVARRAARVRQQRCARVVHALGLQQRARASMRPSWLTVPSTGETSACAPAAIGRAPGRNSRVKKALNDS